MLMCGLFAAARITRLCRRECHEFIGEKNKHQKKKEWVSKESNGMSFKKDYRNKTFERKGHRVSPPYLS
jgi:hypothetical protein